MEPSLEAEAQAARFAGRLEGAFWALEERVEVAFWAQAALLYPRLRSYSSPRLLALDLALQLPLLLLLDLLGQRRQVSEKAAVKTKERFL